MSKIVIAFRSFRRSPNYFLAAMVTLALGLGGAIGIFSIIYNQLYRPLPYAHSNRVVDLTLASQTGKDRAFGSPFDLEKLRNEENLFEKVALYRPVRHGVKVGDENRVAPAAEISSDFFEVLGYHPAFGRFFLRSDDAPGASFKVILGFRYWKDNLGSNPQCLGSFLNINNRPHEIVGIAPENFVWPNLFLGDGVVPEHFSIIPGSSKVGDARDRRIYYLTGLLPASGTLDQGQKRLKLINSGLAQTYPDLYGGITMRVGRLQEKVMEPYAKEMMLFLGAAGLLLLLAAVNLGGLFLSRALSRLREAAIQVALGATWMQLLRPVVLEGLFVATGGAVLGLGLGTVLARFLPLALGYPTSLPGAPEPTLGLVPLILGCLLAASLCIGCSFFSTLYLHKSDLNPYLKNGSWGSVGTRGWGHGIVISVQVGLNLFMLLSLSLLIHSYYNLANRKLGYNSKDVTLMKISLGPIRTDQVKVAVFHKDLFERVGSIAGIQSMGAADQDTVDRTADATRFRLGTTPPDNSDPEVPTMSVGPGYFNTVEIPIIRGRDVTWQDLPQAPAVAIVNSAFSRKFLNGINPIGQYIRTIDIERPIEIVGLVADARIGGPEVDIEPMIFYSLSQHLNGNFRIHLKSNDLPATLSAELANALKGCDPPQKQISAKKLDEIIQNNLMDRRNKIFILMGATLLAIFIASMGLFALADNAVARRRKEIAVRLALGGKHYCVFFQTLRWEMLQVGVGLGVGLAISLSARRILRASLVDLPAIDFVSILFSIVLIGFAVGIAFLVPSLKVRQEDFSDLPR